MKHTPLPWTFREKKFREFVIDSDTHNGIAEVSNAWTNFDEEGNSKGLSQRQIKANAAFIVKACNSHYQLLEALRLLAYPGDYEGRPSNKEILKIAREAIKQAEGDV